MVSNGTSSQHYDTMRPKRISSIVYNVEWKARPRCLLKKTYGYISVTWQTRDHALQEKNGNDELSAFLWLFLEKHIASSKTALIVSVKDQKKRFQNQMEHDFL